MEQALPVRYEETHLVNIEDGAMSLEALQKQINLIQLAMDRNMKDGEHYGKIPGTDKPTLLKPGAEKLCMIFRLNPDYEIIEKVREKGFIAYTVKCSLTHIHTGTHIASGIGSCNSRETKYRYRSQSTGRGVPKEYWEDRDPEKLGGRQFSPRKKDGRWIIYEQIENENPWDLDNTLIKMACKRALVAATLNATAASDIFTQDVEDMPPEIVNAEKTEKPKQEDKKKPPKKQETKKNGFEFLKVMGELKKKLGEEFYYQALGAYGYEHANEIKDRKSQVEIYRDLELEVKRIKREAGEEN